MKMRFSEAEYRGRYERTLALMDARDIDALMITAETNVAYLSGFRHFAPWTTFTRPMLLFISREREPILLVQSFLRVDAARDSWISDIRSYVGLTGVPIAETRELLLDLHLEGMRIGAELGYEQRLGMSYGDFEGLRRALGDTEFVDASELLWSLRMIKSEAEVAAHRRACEIAHEAFEASLGSVRRGMTETEVARVATQMVVEQGGELGFTIMCSGPGNYQRVAGMPTERKLEKGDLLWLDLGVIFNGYWSDYCRAGVAGGPSDMQCLWQERMVRVTAAGIQAIRAGVTASEVARACGDKARDMGLDLTFEAGRLGHGVGLMSTEPPHIALYDETILRPGMVVTLEPGVVNEHGAFVIEENVVVRPDGYEVLTYTSRDLRTL